MEGKNFFLPLQSQVWWVRITVSTRDFHSRNRSSILLPTSERHRLHNKYYAKTTRNAIRDLRNTTDKAAAQENAPKVYAMIDKLAKIGVIHKNKAANLKSGLQVYINKLA